MRDSICVLCHSMLRFAPLTLLYQSIIIDGASDGRASPVHPPIYLRPMIHNIGV